MDATRRITLSVASQPSSASHATSAAAIPLNTWVHLAGTYDGTTASVYVDGILQGTATLPGGYTTTTTPMAIGAASWAVAGFTKGLIDDVRLYNRALTAEEILIQRDASLTIAQQIGKLATLPVAGRFHAVGDVDAYTLNLDAGQKLSVTLKPGGSNSFQGIITVLDPNGAVIGTAVAGSAGETVILQTAPISLSGVYTLQVSTQAGTGAYSLSTMLNATIESESLGGATNNDLTSAIDLASAGVSLQGSGIRYAVTGQTEPGSPDLYRLDVISGEAVSFVLTSTDNTAVSSSVDLLDASGLVLASGLPDGTNTDRIIRGFVAPSTGTYYARINAGSLKPYTLVVTRQADFEREPDGVTGSAQNIAMTGQVLGSIDGRAQIVSNDIRTLYDTVRVAVVGPNATAAGFSTVAGQLRDSTAFNFVVTQVDPTQVDTIAELQAYDVVVTGNTGFIGSDPFGNATFVSALKSWVSTGGGLVTTGFVLWGTVNASAAVRADLDAIIPINVTGQGQNSNATITPNSISHPVTAGVSSFATTTLSEYPSSSPQLDAGAVVLGTANGQPEIVVGKPGNGRSVFLGPAYLGTSQYFRTELQSLSADRLLEQAVAWAGARDQVDQYLVQVNPGQLRLTTTTPGGDTGAPDNTLVPKIELYDSTELLVASNQNGAPDGRNAQVVYQVPTG